MEEKENEIVCINPDIIPTIEDMTDEERKSNLAYLRSWLWMNSTRTIMHPSLSEYNLPSLELSDVDIEWYRKQKRLEQTFRYKFNKFIEKIKNLRIVDIRAYENDDDGR